MSDSVKHECGITLIRLLKPLSYYQEKYGTPLWGFFKLFLMMEKQHNRGQDGAGVAALKLDVPNGLPFMFRDGTSRPTPSTRSSRPSSHSTRRRSMPAPSTRSSPRR
jgi:amidophosphoribosyltransferase